MYTYSNFNDKQDLITKLVLILYMTLYALYVSLWWLSWPDDDGLIKYERLKCVVIYLTLHIINI